MRPFKITLILSFLLTVGVLSAQPGNPRFGQPTPRAIERIESYKKVRMVEALKLDENLSVKFISRYSKMMDVIRKCEQSREIAVKKLEDQMESGAGEAELMQTIGGLMEIEKKIGETKNQFVTELKDLLTVKQIAEYIVFEKNFVRDLRSIIRDTQKNRKHE